MLECVKAIALCHNVTPVKEEVWSEPHPHGQGLEEDEESEEEVLFGWEENSHERLGISYQASSPDEVSILTLYTPGILLNSKDICGV